MNREQIWEFEKDFDDKIYEPKVAKIELKTGKAVVATLEPNTYKIHSQVIQVQTQIPK